MRNIIIQVSGKMGFGKDTVQDLIESYILEFHDKTKSLEFTNVSFSTKLKKVASQMLDVPVPKLSDRDFKNSYLEDWGMTVREFLQKLGTEAVRNGLHNDAWVICYKNDVLKNFDTSGSNINIVFTTDLRMQNEYNLSQEWFGENETYELYQIRLDRRLKIKDWLKLDGIYSLIGDPDNEYSRVLNEYMSVFSYLQLVKYYRFKTEEDLLKFNRVYEARNHYSETSLDGCEGMDYYIENRDDLDELKNRVYTICDSIFSEWSDLDN